MFFWKTFLDMISVQNLLPPLYMVLCFFAKKTFDRPGDGLGKLRQLGCVSWYNAIVSVSVSIDSGLKNWLRGPQMYLGFHRHSEIWLTGDLVKGINVISNSSCAVPKLHLSQKLCPCVSFVCVTVKGSSRRHLLSWWAPQ